MKRGLKTAQWQDAGEVEKPLPKRIRLIHPAVSSKDQGEHSKTRHTIASPAIDWSSKLAALYERQTLQITNPWIVVEKPVPITDSPASVKDTPEHRYQTLLGILENEVVRENITSQLDLKDYLKFEKSSRDLEELLIRRWNVNGRLRRFAAPTPLREVMATFGAIVAGFFPLQFFQNTTWLHIGLDFLVKSGGNADQLKQHLLSEGYKVTNTIGKDDSNETTILKVRYTYSQSFLSLTLLPDHHILPQERQIRHYKDTGRRNVSRTFPRSSPLCTIHGRHHCHDLGPHVRALCLRNPPRTLSVRSQQTFRHLRRPSSRLLQTRMASNRHGNREPKRTRKIRKPPTRRRLLKLALPKALSVPRKRQFPISHHRRHGCARKRTAELHHRMCVVGIRRAEIWSRTTISQDVGLRVQSPAASVRLHYDESQGHSIRLCEVGIGSSFAF